MYATVVNIGEGSTIDGRSDTAKTYGLIANTSFLTHQRSISTVLRIIETQFMPREAMAHQHNLVVQLLISPIPTSL